MSMRKRPIEQQPNLWIPTDDLAKSPGHPFYERLNKLLAEAGFDRFAEERCARFYVEGQARPSIAPGVYMRMLLVGYFEGLDSERGIASADKRRWKGQELARRGTYDNRRRIRGERGKALLRKRGELIERSFAYTLETDACAESTCAAD